MSRQERERERLEKAAEREESDVTLRRTAPERMEGPVTTEEMRTMFGRERYAYERTWRATAGGILSIIAGAWNLLIGIGAVLGTAFLTDILDTVTGGAAIGVGLGTGLIILGLISIIGGIFALVRRVWVFALVGAIAAVFPSPLVFPMLLGVLALIFVAIAHPEFRQT